MKNLPRALVLAIVLSSFALALPWSAAADLYVVPGTNGSITFTNRKPAEGVDYEVFNPDRSSSFSLYRSRWARAWSPKARASLYDTMITKTAEDHSVDPALVKAVVHVESGFNAGARSYKGAMGLMQLMPATARRFGVKNAYTPEENLRGGVRYLKWLLERYSGNLKLALAAYNAGEDAVDDFGGVPPYSETQEYVRRVLSTLRVYRGGAGGAKNS